MLHLAASDAAAEALLRASEGTSLAPDVLFLADDLSCGPIRTLDGAARAAWWGRRDGRGNPEHEALISGLWERLAASDRSLVVWAGQQCAQELAFLLALAHALGEGRPFGLVDVTAPRPSPHVLGRASRSGLADRTCVYLLEPAALLGLIGTERPVASAESAAMRARWQALRQEDAPLRVVTESGLISVPENHFDALLLAEAKREPQKAARVVAGAMCDERAWLQVGDAVLFSRLAALVEIGKLLADGDPSNIRARYVHLRC